MSTTPDWYNFQEDICSHFNSLGADAKTNQTVQGIRTLHDVDILVKTKFLGANLTWVVEAKDWKSNIPKEKVFALRTIVDDIGADKGFIISQKGFQSGAYEAAISSNISLLTFEELKKSTFDYVSLEILKSFKLRTFILHFRYWSHSKQARKDYDLRPDLGDSKLIFSGAELLQRVIYAIVCATKNEYPINVGTYYERKVGKDIVTNFFELRNWLDQNLNLLDSEIIQAEIKMMSDGNFKPNFIGLNFEDMDSLFKESHFSYSTQKLINQFKSIIKDDVINK